MLTTTNTIVRGHRACPGPTPESKFRYFNGGERGRLADDKAEWKELMDVLVRVGFTQSEIQDVQVGQIGRFQHFVCCCGL